MKRTGSGLPGSKAYLAAVSKIVSAASDAFCDLTGYPTGDLLGRDIGDVLKMLQVHHYACNRLRPGIEVSCYLFTKALDPREVTISVLPAQDPYGAVYLFAEKPNSRLENKTIFVNHLFSQEKIGAAIYSVPELMLLKANARYLEDSKDAFDDRTQCIGHLLSELIPEYAGSAIEARWNTVLETQQPYRVKEEKIESRLGTTYWDETQIPIFDGGTLKYIFKHHEDVTDRVLTRQKIKEQENSVREKSEELHHIIESTDDFIFSVDPDYRLIFCNSAFRDFVMSRFGRQLVKGTEMPEVFYPRDPSVWLNTLAQTKNGEKMQFEIKIDSGSRVMSFSFNPVLLDGQLVEITIFGKDITARINGEREIIRLNTTLEQRVQERTTALQQSVKSLQDISRIFSHDLKAPIREIIRCAGEIEQTGNALSYTRKIKSTCTSITKMIDDLSKYALSSDKTLRSETVNLKKMVTAVYNDLKSTYQNDSVLHFETGLPLVRTDQVLMRHVLSNLLSNALKFSSKRELAEITVGCRDENDDYVFYIKDNGVGFDMLYVDKLFTVFERLHSRKDFEGTGIGLAAVRSIIQRLGGQTWIESAQGLGTTIYFTLPIVPEV